MVEAEAGPIRSCGAIVLAAGASRRLGQPKQLLPVRGESLLRRTARIAIEAGCSPAVVVLGYASEECLPELAGLPAYPVINSHWQSGMASSLRCGLNALLAAIPQLDCAILLVCDQPYLETAFLRRLLAAHRLGPAPISASCYEGVRGVPAIFSHQIFPRLLQLEGDQGARRILERHPELVTTVDFPGGRLDIDTPADLGALDQ